MKGTSQYSRPTTAKKTLQSPKFKSKAEEPPKLKTQQNEQDYEQLVQQIQEMIGRQKECESKGKYVQAEGFKRKVKALRELMQDIEMHQMKLRHQRELEELEEAHLAQMNLFKLNWEKNIRQYNEEISQQLEALANRHEEQIKQAENQLQIGLKFKESPKLLELRKIELQLAKQENYMEAHEVQVRANKLEKEEKEKYKRSNNTKGRTNLQNLKNKQQSQAGALKMRIQLQVEEKERERLREEAKLRQKYENILKETEFQQTQEFNKLAKAVKLNQVQKRSKAGMFSYSKDGM